MFGVFFLSYLFLYLDYENSPKGTTSFSQTFVKTPIIMRKNIDFFSEGTRHVGFINWRRVYCIKPFILD